jgi:hypothetical protein
MRATVTAIIVAITIAGFATESFAQPQPRLSPAMAVGITDTTRNAFAMPVMTMGRRWFRYSRQEPSTKSRVL